VIAAQVLMNAQAIKVPLGKSRRVIFSPPKHMLGKCVFAAAVLAIGAVAAVAVTNLVLVVSLSLSA
jgi:hypothetical protein